MASSVAPRGRRGAATLRGRSSRSRARGTPWTGESSECVAHARPGAALRDTQRVCTAGQMRSVQSIIASKVALKNSEDCLQYWGFMYFRDIFSLDQVTVGKMFSVPLALSSVLGNVITGVAESILLKRGMDLLRIRKSMSWIGNTMQAGAVLLFALAPTPFLALVGYFFQRLGALTHPTTPGLPMSSC